MTGLPLGWDIAPIGDLCSLENGRAFKPVEWTTKGLPIVRIQNLNNPQATYNYFNGEFADRYHLRGGELLFAWSGTPGTSFGAHVWHGGEAVLNQHIFRVDFDDSALDKRYFRHSINQKLAELIDIAHGGVGLRHVTKGKFEATEIAIAPFNEQKRIADKLDAVLARVDACRDRLDRIPAILKRFRQSVVSAAVSGKLTDEWRSQQSTDENAGSITSTALADLCKTGRVITYGVIKLGDETPDGVPCLRTSNVRWLRIDPTGMKRIAPSLSAEYSRTILEGAEVLVNVRGTLGGVAVTSADMVGWNVSREVAVVPVDPARADPEFLALWIASDRQQRWLSKVEKGVTYVGINIEDLRTLPVELPSFSEQREIVRRVESLFAYADRIEARYAAAHSQVEKLTPSLLAKAFRGELVPQNPNDEPASVLLERISSKRAATEVQPRRRQSTAGRKPTRAPKENAAVNKSRQDEDVQGKPYLAQHLRLQGGSASAEALFKVSELPVADFYKQLAWEVAQGYVRDGKTVLELTDAA